MEGQVTGDFKWSTREVENLCRSIRADRDATGCPSLANALERAGYSNDKVLNALRRRKTWDLNAQVALAEVTSRQTESALMYLMRQAEDASMDFRQMMEAAEKHLGPEDETAEERKRRWDSDTHMGENEAYKNVDWSDEFWEAYQTVTGRLVPERLQHCFFSCSC